MYDTDADTGRIDRDHYEESPSTDWRTTARILGAVAGTGECDAPKCNRDGDPVVVVDVTAEHVRESVRCSTHTKDFLEVST